MRHGETSWNELDKIQGKSRCHLSKTGKEHVQLVAEDLKFVDINYIFCSPLVRTVQTAKIVNTYHNLKIIKDERISETEQGFYTGKCYNNLTKKDHEIRRQRNSHGLESYQHVFNRVKSFYDDLIKEYINNSVLIVTHCIVANILEHLIKQPNCEYKEIKDELFLNFHQAEIKQFII